MTASDSARPSDAVSTALAHAPGGYRPPGMARLTPLAVWAMLGAAVAYVLANNPTDRSPDALGGCGWYAVFGTNGPTCGGTRMVWYLVHGDVVNAARSHLLALIGTPFVLYALAQWSAAWLFGLRLPPLRLKTWVFIAYVAVFVLYGAVLRNLPGFEWFHLDYMQPGIGL
jgi:Protein of unknown function (DUF2752)